MLNKPKCSNCSIDLKLGPLSDLPQKKSKIIEMKI